jgi:hypothetical protein
MEDVLIIFNVIGGIASTSLALLTFLGLLIAKSKQGKEKIKEILKESLGITEMQDRLKSLQCVKVHSQIELQSKALLSLIRKDLMQLCKHCLEQKRVTIAEREVIIESYKVYKDLKGNHFVSDLVKTVLELPVSTNDLV